MLQSMTGYGKAEINLKNINFTVEVKSLNSKQIDISVKMPSCYRDKEIGLRKLLSEKLQRGKIELLIWTENIAGPTGNYTLNNKVISDYFNQVKEILASGEFGSFAGKDVLPSLLKMPNVIQKEEQKLHENEWREIQKGIDTAVADLLQFRLDEGEKLELDIHARIERLVDLLNTISPFARARIAKVKKSLSKKILESDTKNVDENRLEQELIYYLEKQDITEEQVRLEAHLNYFRETISAPPPSGKKLGFIGQEIGREINTIGSKSSDVNMQKIVVQMKDELEKIKEQLLNIL